MCIKKVELDTRSQAKGSGFFRHRAGRIGASVSGAVCHCNLAQPPQSLIKSICYPHLKSAQPTSVVQGALNCDTICTCQSKPNSTDKLLECHGATWKSGKYFHLHCLNLKRMPNNAKTT